MADGMNVSKRRAKQTLLLSFIVTAFCGGVVLTQHWLARDLAFQAMVRSTLFVIAMVLAHVLGYHLYRQQPIRWAAEYRAPLEFSLVLQIPILLMFSLILDGGLLFRVTLIACVAYWVLVALIICRRPAAPTSGDLRAVRSGFLMTLSIAGYVLYLGRVAGLH